MPSDPAPPRPPGPARYAGRRVALATRHGKERAIRPAVTRHLGATLVVPPDLPTDALGTFTGEVERPGSAEAVVRAKARMGADAAGLSLAIATEASFGPDPFVPFVAAHHETAIFLDLEAGIEVEEALVRHDTNLRHIDLADDPPPADLDAFLEAARFPSHGLIVRPAGPVVVDGVTRDVLDRAALAAAIERARRRSRDGLVRIETDMRAHRNPARMAGLAELAERLLARVATGCPACGRPGFGRMRVETGLPCAWCGTPTDRIREVIEGCAGCGLERRRPRTDGATTADPGACPTCNP